MAVRPGFKTRCQQEMTRDVVFLLERCIMTPTGSDNVPDGYVVNDCGDIVRESDGDRMTNSQLVRHGLAIQDWKPESVWLSREEAEDWARRREYNFPDGWRVYGLPSEGDLAALLINT